MTISEGPHFLISTYFDLKSSPYIFKKHINICMYIYIYALGPKYILFA